MTTIQEKLTKAELLVTQLKAKLEAEKNKTNWIKISKTEEISTIQLHNNKTYAEILKLLNKDERIADYTLLRDLRNEGFDSNWTKYPFLKDFWVFVPQEDKVSEKNNYVARFNANSDGADLGCDRFPSNSIDSLGVFVVRKVKDV
jgi:hypothetical protein